mmetsp:Transcript_17877/g.37398  ORF Transcript_17877/g.37398 Transcript_17877/m.37398 type:complete len:226 (+) Transcript_17877:51-728(+)
MFFSDVSSARASSLRNSRNSPRREGGASQRELAIPKPAAYQTASDSGGRGYCVLRRCVSVHSGYLVYVGTIGAYSRWFSRQLGSTQPRGALFAAGTSEGGSGGRPRIASAIFSAVMIVGALRLPLVIEGKMEASTTRRPSVPYTAPSGPTTAMGSSSAPILHVPHGWYALSRCSFRYSSSSSSVCAATPGAISSPRTPSKHGWSMISRVNRRAVRQSSQSSSRDM